PLARQLHRLLGQSLCPASGALGLLPADPLRLPGHRQGRQAVLTTSSSPLSGRVGVGGDAARGDSELWPHRPGGTRVSAAAFIRCEFQRLRGPAAMEHLRYPNESAEYRAARNALLEDEIALRAQIEAVAAQRRALPLGGKVPEDYVFERSGRTSMPEKVRMSELFGPHDTLILYSFMYGPERDLPCTGCTHLLDGLDGAARH